MLGDVATARAYAIDAVALARQHNLGYELALAYSPLSMIAFFSGDDEAIYYAEEGIKIAQATGNPWLVILGKHNAARMAALRGNLEEAIPLYQAAADGYLQLRHVAFHVSARSDLGHLYRRLERYSDAQATYRETILLWKNMGHRAAVAHELECFGYLALIASNPQRAVQLWGAAERLREEVGSPQTLNEVDEYHQAVLQARTQLGEPAFTTAWQAGRMLALDEAIALALA
jgi:tetratricopeptide (TPR) repeat protein